MKYIAIKTKCCTILYLLVLLIFISCGKSKSSPTPPPIDDDLPPQYGTPFSGVPDTKDIIMYEININAFSPQHNINGIISRLDNIKDLGVNVIWLMPIHPLGVLKAFGSPYCVKDYNEVNPAFGNLEDLRTLVSEAHKRGLAVILDLVANHTSFDNVWTTNKSWYKQDAEGNIAAALPYTDVAALNYNNKDMRKAMIDVMRYWVLTANVDGFRCDYADGVPVNFWKEANDALKRIPNRKLIMLAEGTGDFLFYTGFQMNYAWDFFRAMASVFRSNFSPSTLITTNLSEIKDAPDGAYPLRFTANHDEDIYNTPLDRYNGKNGSIAAFVLTSYIGGVPLIYNGQEIGHPNVIPMATPSNINWSINPEMTDTYKKLIAFRKESNAVKSGSIESYGNDDIAVFKRKSGTQEVLVLVNVRNTSITYPLTSPIANTNWKDAMNNDAAVSLTNEIVLPAYSYKILH